MKIVVATTAGGLEDNVSPVFGRCQTFTIVDVEGKKIKDTSVVQNQYASGMSGVGIQAGQFVAQQGAKAVIAGNYGPNVVAVLGQAGIEMISAQGKVEEVVKKYLNKELKPSMQPTTQQMPFGRGMGGGMGRGMGRGMYGMPQQPSQQPMPQQPSQQPMPQQPIQPMQPMPRQQEIQMLEQQAKNLENQLEQIKKRIEELKE